METSSERIILKTHRFVFSNHIIDYLSEFAKIHQYDDRKIFKEAWETWVKDEEINPIINEEIKRLTNIGFVGDVLDKMFKSTRYYYRNKSNTNDESTDKKPRKKYETLPIHFLETIDEHIHKQIKLHSNQNLDEETKISTISPAESFNLYLLENKSELLQQLKDSLEIIKKSDIEDMIRKYKKTYKNRFYNIRVAMNN
jgi:hypothetical protein